MTCGSHHLSDGAWCGGWGPEMECGRAPECDVQTCALSLFSSIQSLSHVWLFAAPWTEAHQASLSFTISLSLLKLMSIESMMSSSITLYSSCPQSFPASGSFPVSWLFTSGGQIIGASASASVLPMNIQDWFPLGWTGLMSLMSKGLSRVFFSTTVWKPQFFSTQPSLWSISHICTRILEKPLLWLFGPLLAKWYPCFLIHCLDMSWLFFQGVSLANPC